MTLRQKQSLFAELVARLIDRATDELEFELTLGEVYRPPETAALYAKQGRGIAGSLHASRLAIDINLFRNGKLCKTTEEYRELGEWWEQQGNKYAGIQTCWGGRFGDGGHFSIAHAGKK